jgi:hypothetical protein
MSLLFPWLLPLVLVSGVPGPEPIVDFSGVHEFARIVATLQGDEEPAPEAWARLFRTPGYAALTRSEFPESFFMDRFRLVFMPSKARELDEALESADGWTGAYLRHYVRVRDRWDEIMAYVDHPPPSRVLSEARRRALEYLPPTVPDHVPPVAYVVFGPDARGYVPVVLDVLNAMDKHDEELLLWLAHEFHHYYRNAVLSYNREAMDPADEHILWVLDQLQAEGTANQVNLKEAFKDREEFRRRWPTFVEGYLASSDVIRTMDSFLARMDAGDGDWMELGLALRRSIPSSGHPTGFFMANLIFQELGRDRLVREVGNPFAFLRSYHEAALLSQGREGPPLSDAALRVVEEMERKYARPGASSFVR